MLTLKQLAIKKICESIQRLSLFIRFSPLPWSLSEEIIRNFGNYKWKQLHTIAESSMDLDINLLYDFEFESDIKPDLRNALLSINDYEPFTHNDAYCSRTNYYKIKKYNLILCKSCFIIFKEILRLRSNKKKIGIIFQEYHEPYLSYELVNLYHKQSSWCHNEFNEVLFELKDRFDCIDEIHSSNSSSNFHAYEMSLLSSSDEEGEDDSFAKRIRLIPSISSP